MCSSNPKLHTEKRIAPKLLPHKFLTFHHIRRLRKGLRFCRSKTQYALFCGEKSTIIRYENEKKVWYYYIIITASNFQYFSKRKQKRKERGRAPLNFISFRLINSVPLTSNFAARLSSVCTLQPYCRCVPFSCQQRHKCLTLYRAVAFPRFQQELHAARPLFLTRGLFRCFQVFVGVTHCHIPALLQIASKRLFLALVARSFNNDSIHFI